LLHLRSEDRDQRALQRLPLLLAETSIDAGDLCNWTLRIARIALLTPPRAATNPLDPPKPSCDVGFIGSASAAPELSLVARTSSDTMITLSDNGSVPLLTRPREAFSSSRARA